MAAGKACRTCGAVKPLVEYHQNCRTRDGRLNHCKACSNANQNMRNAALGREHIRARNLKTKYGMTLAEFEARREAQGGRCAICDTTATLVVDHCHETGKNRDLLCAGCNRLAVRRDLLLSVLAYVERHAS